MNTKSIRWAIWLLAAVFYFYEFILRVSPGVILPELMQKFSLNASQVGFLTSLFLWGYAPMQLPVGLLMDRFGLKIILTVASIAAGVGVYLFAASSHVTAAATGRLFIGAASAFGFIAMVYVSTHFFSEKKRAFLVGLANSLSMLGASLGTGPVSSAIRNIGWEITFKWFGALGIILGCLIYLTLRKENEKKASCDVNPYPLRNIISSAGIWINALVALLFFQTTAAFAGLWGTNYLQTVNGFTKEAASYGMSIYFAGCLIGGPLIGLASDYFKKRTAILGIGIMGCLLAIILVLYFNLPFAAVYVCLFFAGLFSTAQLLNFTLAIEMSSLKAKATAAAVTNFLVSSGDAVIQSGLGFLLDLNWKGGIKNGIRVYGADCYKKAFSILPSGLILALLFLYVLSRYLSKRNLSIQPT